MRPSHDTLPVLSDAFKWWNQTGLFYSKRKEIQKLAALWMILEKNEAKTIVKGPVLSDRTMGGSPGYKVLHPGCRELLPQGL